MESRILPDEIVLPSLLWRIDELGRAGATHAVSLSVYRNEVLRNLRWILNTSALPSDDPIWNFPEAASSVINFGLPPYAGLIGDDLNLTAFAARVRSAILFFEPRILAQSLRVVPIEDDDVEGSQDLGITIEGNIWCEPVPERFEMEARIDAASGEWSFQ